MAKQYSGAATKALQQELKSLQKEPLEGFTVQLLNDNLFEWEVAIFGPPNTLYQGGYFKSMIKFPHDYPYSPPTVRFSTKMWHPNIYENGDVCISILHPPVDDPTNTELPSEKWNPAQNVRWSRKFFICISKFSIVERCLFFKQNCYDEHYILAEWAQHVFSSQCGRLGHVQAVHRLQGSRQGIWKHYKVIKS